MIEKIEIRESLPCDLASIEALCRDAFPEEDLLPLVRDLLKEDPVFLSLVGLVGQVLVGHVVFTQCGIAEKDAKLSLLGPLAVTPARQKRGIGKSLIREGLLRLENAGVSRVYVLGDPNYYRRFGFAPEDGVTPPYPLPAEWLGAWQSISLNSAEPPPRGALAVPPEWRQPALWSA